MNCSIVTAAMPMGIEAIYRKRRTSIPAQDNKIYPYLLANLAIKRPNQVWAVDITYLPLAKGVRISMDSKGRWVDNVFVERLSRSVKYENLYLLSASWRAEFS